MQLAHLEYQLDNSILTQRTLRLRIGAADVAAAVNSEATKLRAKVQVGGFRKGKAPLAVIRRELWPRIAAAALAELKRAALDQVLQRLDDRDKPFLPPAVLDEARLKLRYGLELEFAVKYLLDPAGVTRNPGHPEFSTAAPPPTTPVPAAAAAPGVPPAPRRPALPDVPLGAA